MLRQDFKQALLVVAVAGLLGLLTSTGADAVPSFARQTGQACNICHTSFPALTPYGRTFKLTGYVLSKSEKVMNSRPRSRGCFRGHTLIPNGSKIHPRLTRIGRVIFFHPATVM